MNYFATGLAIFGASLFLLVVLARSGPKFTDVSLPPPTDSSAGWKQDPTGDGFVRFWDGSRWAALRERGTLGQASNWEHPVSFRTSSKAIRVLGLAILTPLVVVTPFVMLVSYALSRVATTWMTGGSNK
jgi:Protein of unknown function (DUF2510)